MIFTVAQLHSTPDSGDNIKRARQLMLRAVREHDSDWILLPEHFHWAGGTAEEVTGIAEVFGEGPAYEMCRDFAREHEVFVHAGSIFERIPGDRQVYNTSVAFDRRGNEVARYRKIHLFDFTSADGHEIRESNVVRPGADVVVYQADNVKVGCAICYDLRFPELFQALVRRGAQLIALPASFTYPTGEAHWEALVRARAIEAQTYIAAAGAFGVNETGVVGRRTFGHSMLIDPWGRVIEVLPDGERLASCPYQPELVAKVRRDMPLSEHRRRTLYRDWIGAE